MAEQPKVDPGKQQTEKRSVLKGGPKTRMERMLVDSGLWQILGFPERNEKTGDIEGGGHSR